MELSRLARTARAALSCMVTCSEAWTISTGRLRWPSCWLNSFLQDIFAAYQDDLHAQAPGGPNRALDFRLRGGDRRPLRQQRSSP